MCVLDVREIMKIENKGIICRSIWGWISLKYCVMSVDGINLIFLKSFENVICLPDKIVLFFAQLIFEDLFLRGKLLIILILFFVLGPIFMGAFLGYLISKIIKKIR